MQIDLQDTLNLYKKEKSYNVFYVKTDNIMGNVFMGIPGIYSSSVSWNSQKNILIVNDSRNSYSEYKNFNPFFVEIYVYYIIYQASMSFGITNKVFVDEDNVSDKYFSFFSPARSFCEENIEFDNFIRSYFFELDQNLISLPVALLMRSIEKTEIDQVPDKEFNDLIQMLNNIDKNYVYMIKKAIDEIKKINTNIISKGDNLGL